MEFWDVVDEKFKDSGTYKIMNGEAFLIFSINALWNCIQLKIYKLYYWYRIAVEYTHVKLE